MRRALIRLSWFMLIAASARTAEGQTLEVTPYAGGLFPGRFADAFEIKRGPVYGIRGGVNATSELTIEGNVESVRHLEFAGTGRGKTGLIWEGFVSHDIPGLHWRPRVFATFGIGGMRTSVSPDTNDFWGASISTSHSFLAFSYGGGVKAPRLWGPIGYRADLHARTLPHYYGFRVTWPELTGGLTFSRSRGN